MNIDECLTHLTSFKEGKRLQYYAKDYDTWYDIVTLNSLLDLMRCNRAIRLKPTPREWWVNVYPDGTSGSLRGSKEVAQAVCRCEGGETIRVREVIEEGGAS